MPAFDIPGLDFFDTTGKAPNSFISCRKLKKKCIEINAHVPDYDYEDDSLEGRITLFDKGVHLAPIYMLSD
jgi:hypothetical protein